MSTDFYRFRPASALLDGFHELEKQEIYFPTLKELNDPVEGYKDILWRGDAIVWRNLLRHYLLCLMHSVFLTAVQGKDFKPETAFNVVHQTDDDLPEAPIRQIFAAACYALFAKAEVQTLVAELAKSTRAVRRDELIFYLRLLHPAALAILLDRFAEQGSKLMETGSLTELGASSLKSIPAILRQFSIAAEIADAISFANESIMHQLALVQEFNDALPEERRPWLHVARNFPSEYVRAIENLLFPDWHAACFVTDPTNAAMWGHYGHSHQGMCLKFKAGTDSDGKPALDLYQVNSWGSNGAGYAYVPHRFEPIEYTSGFPEISFFESMGRIPVGKLSRFWYCGPAGERSEIADRILSDQGQWREGYWAKFASSYRVKMPHWSYENEHRLVLHSSLADLSTKESRKLKYRFEDLTGIIFGIETSTENKLAAMKVIEEKCAEAERTDFEFWQARYSHRSRQIDLLPLNLLKFDH